MAMVINMGKGLLLIEVLNCSSGGFFNISTQSFDITPESARGGAACAESRHQGGCENQDQSALDRCFHGVRMGHFLKSNIVDTDALRHGVKPYLTVDHGREPPSCNEWNHIAAP